MSQHRQHSMQTSDCRTALTEARCFCATLGKTCADHHIVFFGGIERKTITWCDSRSLTRGSPLNIYLSACWRGAFWYNSKDVRFGSQRRRTVWEREPHLETHLDGCFTVVCHRRNTVRPNIYNYCIVSSTYQDRKVLLYYLDFYENILCKLTSSKAVRKDGRCSVTTDVCLFTWNLQYFFLKSDSDVGLAQRQDVHSVLHSNSNELWSTDKFSAFAEVLEPSLFTDGFTVFLLRHSWPPQGS